METPDEKPKNKGPTYEEFLDRVHDFVKTNYPRFTWATVVIRNPDVPDTVLVVLPLDHASVS